ncbi:MAG TPA: pyridoxal phosphate-dependent aminotransferase [Atribacteraceae bacterium]|nr:pyridoxal phosphate-dependent aminotransferase [Atribacteraceae bacterium]
MVKASEYVCRLPRSGIRELMGMALCIQGAIHLEMGEPHFSTPPFVIERLQEFFSRGEVKYTPTIGIPSLREAIVRQLKSEKGWETDLEQVMILPGSLFGTVVVFRAMLEPGDDVLVPDPGFTNHFSQVELCGGRINRYFLRQENDYLPDFSEIRTSITPRTRIILVNSPSNPLGVVFPAQVMEEFARLSEEFNLLVVSDEAYEHYVYEGTHQPMFKFVPPERLVSIFSFSKTYALTGWRVAYMVVPVHLASHLMKVEEYLIACTSHIGQKAAEAALDMPRQLVLHMVASYDHNRRLALRLLDEGGYTYYRPRGGYYIWIDIREFGISSLEWCKTVLQKTCVALAPGDTFGQGGEGFARLSFCRREDEVTEGVRRLAKFRRECLS